MHKRILILMILCLSFVLLACDEKELDLKIRFDQVHGLKPGNRVLFGENHIGTVERVVYTDQGVFLVHIVISNDFKKAATEETRFFIVEDPEGEENKAVQLVHIRQGGAPLQNKATVEGSTRTTALFQQLADEIEQGIRLFQEQIEQFSKDLQRIPENEEFKKLENELKLLAEEMKKSGQAAREKIKKEMLPQLRKEMEKLREKLRQLGREEEMKPLEVQFEKIQKI